MAKTPLEHKDIIKLIAELGEETPEYPIHLMSARKAAFIKKVTDIKVSKEDDSGKGGGPKGGKTGLGGGAGSSGAALRKKSLFLGISLKRAITIGVILVMAVALYFMRDQITEVMAENGIITTEETATPSNGFRLVVSPTNTPVAGSGFGAPAGDPKQDPGNGVAPGGTVKNSEGEAGQGQEVSTAPEQREPGSAFKFLFCILSLRGDACK